MGDTEKKQEKAIAAFTKRLQKEFLLKEKTVAVLLDNEVDSFEALGTLTEDTISSPEFGLSVGQAGLLKKAVKVISSDTKCTITKQSDETTSPHTSIAMVLISILKLQFGLKYIPIINTDEVF